MVVNLSYIDISNNHGAAETTLFIEEFISRAPGIVDIKASNHLIPEESLQDLKATLAGLGREYELLENDVQQLEIHFP